MLSRADGGRRGVTRGATQEGVVGALWEEERGALSKVELFPPRDSGLRPPATNKGKMCQVRSFL